MKPGIYFLFFSHFAVSTSTLFAQSTSTQIGSRPNGLAYATSALFDEWGAFNNIAGIAKAKTVSANFTYDLHPTLTGANRTAAAFLLPLKFGVATVGAFRFGDDLYNEQLLTVGFSSQFGLAALGSQVNYIQCRTEGFGSKGVWSLNLGGIAELTPQLSVGAYIVNVTQPKVSESEKLPTKMIAGIGFKPIEKIFIAGEIEKDLDYDPVWKMGIEYKFNSKFSARTGYHLNPNKIFFGLGFNTKKFILDYAIQHNYLLGLSHQASIRYQFEQK